MKRILIIVLAITFVIACNTKVNFEGFYKPESVQFAEQGWSEGERDYWHHLNAGQEFAPLSWLKSLQAPDTSLLLADPAYLRSLGFLDKSVTENNPEGLPIGFSIKPADKNGRVMVGLNCASCHTGQINFKGKALRIDGASAGFNIYQFFVDYGIALGKTIQDSAAWRRFSSNVLKQEPGDELVLRKEVEDQIRTVQWESEAYAKTGIPSVNAGHGRMDPFNRIGNEVFGLGLRDQSNYYASDAPVGVPYLWDIARLNWVHYNASFNHRVSRNILQVLGNGGKTYFLDENGDVKKGNEKWESNFNIERLLETEKGYATLKAPQWPDEMLGKVDMNKAKRGRELFMTNCANCHAPRPINGSNSSKPDWAVVTLPFNVIGTDSSEAAGFVNRRYDASKLLGKKSTSIDAATGLELLISEMAKYAYSKLGWSAEQIAAANGDDRPNKIRAYAGYKARPLDGVWSTPPFLHNGSVPNLYELLSPPEERSTTFWLGTYEYDPIKLGYVSMQSNKSFLFDTRLPGNSNAGHAFSDEKKVTGKIGRKLSHEERMAIIEYVKVLTTMPPAAQKPVERNWNK
ncbi:MAG: hypothetical protein RI983_1376 [Bacteroidota bacterium]|jgi:hypothetical protein